ncbi:uncharacterized protein AMSG_04787 [Thecamonas trahens ATCC 50062]|uniref:Palmitoyltransferase n=1 Tax=Thecamonas trahens ATCC 50062 TaxID=461836 RepID=A0A0L0D7H4_THETB|nr:hypothetical protein AMSG_04787 [Thecamonas trahens ATCC 50062]KNC48337.1 hypothetical protein AMSG_04787 [Thecamonas trahens ATCC 50062]|eukprot:XP_013758462.1 hypothetical protein AMSG_04787 [Thecamonas trahens ATCC 50062]
MNLPLVVGVLVVVAASPLVLDGLHAVCPRLGIGRRAQRSAGYMLMALLAALPHMGIGLLWAVFAPYVAAEQNVVSGHVAEMALSALGLVLFAGIIRNLVAALFPPSPDGGREAGWEPAWVDACRECGLDAVPERDHHCVFLNRCVDASNHTVFVRFVVFLWLGASYALAISGYGYLECGYHVRALVRPPSCAELEGMHILALPLIALWLPLTLLTLLVVRLAIGGLGLSRWLRAWRRGHGASNPKTAIPRRRVRDRGWRVVFGAS